LGATPDTLLETQVDDIVTWNYTTKKGDPLPPDQGSAPVGNYLSDKIPAHMSSRPSYNVMMPASGDIIDYCCKLHPKMRGKIKVTAIPGT